MTVDTNNCTVCALSAAVNITHEAAFELMKNEGRVTGEGASVNALCAAAEAAGYITIDCLQLYKHRLRRLNKNVPNLIKVLPEKGVFLVVVAQNVSNGCGVFHVLTVRDKTVYDNLLECKFKHVIYDIIRIQETSCQSPVSQ